MYVHPRFSHDSSFLYLQKKPEASATEQAILLEAVRIIKQHGAKLGDRPK